MNIFDTFSKVKMSSLEVEGTLNFDKSQIGGLNMSGGKDVTPSKDGLPFLVFDDEQACNESDTEGAKPYQKGKYKDYTKDELALVRKFVIDVYNELLTFPIVKIDDGYMGGVHYTGDILNAFENMPKEGLYNEELSSQFLLRLLCVLDDRELE